MDVFIDDQLNETGAIIPPNGQNDLKVTCDISFVNTTEVSAQVFMSVPPPNPEAIHQTLLEEMRSELQRVSDGILGKTAGQKDFRSCRICW